MPHDCGKPVLFRWFGLRQFCGECDKCRKCGAVNPLSCLSCGTPSVQPLNGRANYNLAAARPVEKHAVKTA